MLCAYSSMLSESIQYFHEQKVTTNVNHKKQAVCNSHSKGFDDVKAWPLSSVIQVNYKPKLIIHETILI